MNKYYITGDLEQTLPFSETELDLSSIRKDLMKIIEKSLNLQKICEFIDYQRIADFFNEKKNDDELIFSLENGLYIPNPDFNYSCTRTYQNIADIVRNPKNYQLLQRNGESIGNPKALLEKNVLTSGSKDIVICDDGIFSGDTIQGVIKTLNGLGKNVKEIRVVLNFSGKKDIGGIPIVSLYSPSNCIDRIDERDFFYGTKMGGASVKDENGNIFGVPYCYNGEIINKKASLPNKTANILKGLNTELYSTIGKLLGRETQIGESERLKYLFGKKERNKTIVQLLSSESYNIDIEKGKVISEPNLFGYDTIIRDQDGTLYQLDGDGTFGGSTLGKLVNQSIVKFICEKENCSEESAQTIKSELSVLEKAQGKPISQSLAEKYNMTRTEVFERTWGSIEPIDKMILNFEATKELLRINKEKGIKNIVVTGAPKVRAEKVMEFMGTKDFIYKAYTAEDYEGDKGTIFSKIKQKNTSDKILSIGDQEKNDILPAIQNGIDGFIVSGPSDLSFAKN